MIGTTLQALLLLAGLAAGETAHDQQGRQNKQVYAVTPGGTLEVNVASGSMRVTAWEKNELMIQAPGLSEEDQALLRVSQSGNTVHVEYHGGDSRDGDFVLRITVPGRFNALLHTGGGDIEMRGPLSGKLTGETAGGDIRLSGLKGVVSMTTSGGDIEAGDIEGSAELSSSGGEIRAGSITGKADLSTGGGDVEIRNAGKDLVISTSGGNIRVGGIGGSTTARTAGGDIDIQQASGPIILNTAGGSISVGSAPGGIDAKTAGGDMTLKNVGDHIDAGTASGNIDVEFLPGALKESTVGTADGNIRLRIPAGLKATARVQIQGDTDEEGAEELPFASSFKPESQGWERHMQEYRATVPLSGGGEDLKVKVIDGRVDIVPAKGRGK